MNLTLAELFLAYRQAKASLQQEKQGLWKISWAAAEQDIQSLLLQLQKRLRASPGWFAALAPGTVWLVPKKADSVQASDRLTQVGGSFRASLASLSVRPHLAPTPLFSTVETLWLWTFGPALEATLGSEAKGNRLRLVDGGRRVNRFAPGCFSFWPTAYKAFRDDGFAAARALLEGKYGRCLLATFDLTSYYDEIDPSFLIADDFVTDVRSACLTRSIPFDDLEYVRATRTLIRAFARYRMAASRLTGVAMRTGIPIGCLSSKLISNVALGTLDTTVRSQGTVKYYARYVDDILLVADATRYPPRSARGIARTFLPLAGRSITKAGIALDSRRLRRPGSRFILQPSKLKGYLLVGRPGLDFLDIIARNVRMIASERRAFLVPEGLGSPSPLKALFVGHDADAPVQVLREVDKVKIERYAASVALSRTATSVEILDRVYAAGWCRRQLAPLCAHLTGPDQWLNFIELAFRALAVCLRAGDYETARSVLRRHEANFTALLARPPRSVSWNGKRLRWPRVQRDLRRWYDSRREEVLAASLPLGLWQKGYKRPSFVPAKSVSRLGRSAELLSLADLRAVDRETDLETFSVERGQRSPRVGRLSRSIAVSPLTANRAKAVEDFLSTCRRLNDAIYAGLSVVDIWRMTRPPRPFDISRRWAKSGRSMSELVSIINAVRGNSYREGMVRQGPDGEIDFVGGPSGQQGSPSQVRVVLANLTTTDAAWLAAAKGRPIVNPPRLAEIGRIVNETIATQKIGRIPCLLVLPELSLPRRLLRSLAHHLAEQQVSLVAGVEYAVTPKGVINEAVGVFSTGLRSATAWWWRKPLPASVEFQELFKNGLRFATGITRPAVVKLEFGAISTLICSEILDVEARATLLGRVDVLLVPSWNKDTATFEHTIQTTANDLHCHVAVANNARYSDCRVQSPESERYLRDACRLVVRNENRTVGVTLAVAELRAFQLESLAFPEDPPERFKPLPPAFIYRRP